MKSDRLLSILLLLQAHGQLPATDLARRLEVSVRTIFRDVEALSAAGVPVYAERGRTGGIALLPGYHTDVTGLTADEAKALFVLVSGRTHAELGLGGAIGPALRKVMAALPTAYRGAAEQISRRVLVDPSRWNTTARPPAELAVLQDAVFTDRRLRLRYRHGGDSEVSGYTLDPYGLVDKAGVWYLVADLRAEPRMFRVDRMVSARTLAEPVRRRKGVELAGLWETLRASIDEIPAPVSIVVLVHRRTLGRFLRVHHDDLAGPPPVLGADDGTEWVRLELRMRSLGSAQRLFAFAADVEIVSPQALRDEFTRLADEITALYAANRGR